MQTFDSYDGSLVLDGFEKGIADSPFDGIADMRNCNVISVPGEASVSFGVAQISMPTVTGNLTTTSSSANNVTLSNPVQQNAAIYFLTLSDATKGLVLNTPYFVGPPSGGTNQLYTDYDKMSIVTITANSLTGTYSTYVMGKPKSFVSGFNNWMIDANGLVWSDSITTVNGPAYWTYTGNLPNNTSSGQGLLIVRASDGTEYVFAISGNSIDYTSAASAASVAWQYQWNVSAGSVGSWNANPTNIFKSNTTGHQTLWAADGSAYICDGSWIDVFYNQPALGVFVPTTRSTYVFAQYELLPNDTATCLGLLGLNLLIGGVKNILYTWDTLSQNPNNYIILPEFNMTEMVIVNSNAYLFMGNRGRIYIANGTNAQLYKKIPDHISGTIEPYFIWGGACTYKNQIYFGVKATTNSGTAIPQYGGVWAIDMDTNALRLTNQLSYGTYAGYATAIIPNLNGNPNGYGLFIGWDNGSSYGLDTTISTPYTGSQATIDSDLVPIGTYTRPRNFNGIEYRLTRPLVSGESIAIYTRLIFNTHDTGYSATPTLTDSTVGNYSNRADINFEQAQWVQFQIVLNSTASSPSFVRLKQIRILGLVGPTMATNQTLGD
jgi:hypothetical protein